MFIIGSSNLFGQITLPGIIGNNMVLQRNATVPIWGWAEPGEEIKLMGNWDDNVVCLKADESGKWIGYLTTSHAGGPHELRIDGSNSLLLTNIMLGDVWLCSGQSNMYVSVEKCGNSEKALENADDDNLRIFSVGYASESESKQNCKGQWDVSGPDTALKFSAVAYYFGKELRKELGVPIGLIKSAVGASAIQRWMPDGYLPFDKEKIPLLKGQFHGLYNGMIAPLVPFSIKGVIWYQGERNANYEQAQEYDLLLPALIQSWRDVWGKKDLPFGFVQLPNYRKVSSQPVQDTLWPRLRQAQLNTLKSVRNTGMAVTIDIGEPNDIHPKNKYDVGKRLSLWALSNVYGKDNFYSGPIYKSMDIFNDKAIIKFDHVDGGLIVKNGDKLAGFAMAGNDRKFFKVDARILNDTVTLRSDNVSNPIAVRYAWADNPTCNLYDKSGLPASPFRTDQWEKVESGIDKVISEE
jgi:sialate O-acetylesterase